MKKRKLLKYILYFLFITIVILISSRTTTVKEKAEYDISELISTLAFQLERSDGNKLLEEMISKFYPKRPSDPKSLMPADSEYWFDEEFPGYNIRKSDRFPSPNQSVQGKKVILLKGEAHPYWSAFERGFTKVAKLFEIEFEVMNSEWNIDLQLYQTDQAIKKNPDMIIFCPVNPVAAVPIFKKIRSAGIPLFVANQVPAVEAFDDIIAWVGPDDWGNMRLLARAMADKLEKQGNYAVIGHMEGTNVYDARAFAPITELRNYAPDMKLLDLKSANLNPDTTKQLVYDWLVKYGDDLNGIIVPDAGGSIAGVLKALETAGRKDVVVVSSGHSKQGLDYVRSEDIYAITYQSAESEGATILYTAIRWYAGYEIRPIQYLKPTVIFKDDVGNYLPAEW